MRILDSAQVRAALAYPVLVDALAAMLRRMRDGAALAPQRTVVPLPLGGSLLVMPAADAELAMTKLVTVHPHNITLPVVQTDVLVCSASSGERLMLLDGEAITGRRTAALSALAARTLAPGNTGPLLLVGAGAQAAAHLEAFVAVLGVQEVLIASRTPPRARDLAEYAAGLGLSARVIADPAAALDQPPPPPDRPILFKSVGHALWDLAAVKVIVEGLRTEG